MSIRVCFYNIEWFNHLFNKNNTLKTGQKEQARLDAIKNVLARIDPDLVGVVEAPNTTKDYKQSSVTKLENFTQYAGLRIKKAMIGFISGGTQEIAVMYDPNKLTIVHEPGGKKNLKSNPPFDGTFYFDTDDDRIQEVYKNYRPPLEAHVKVKNNGSEFNIIVAHTKSKGIFNSMDMLHWERESVRNRLKLYAECEWIHRRIDEWLDNNKHFVVMGDFNDGPGMDFYEHEYGRSAIEIVMGDIFKPDRVLRNCAGKPKWTANGWKPASARFKDRMTGDNINVLIDHILVSQGLAVSGNSPHKIWNPYEDNEAKTFKIDLTKASDHFPVTLDLNL